MTDLLRELLREARDCLYHTYEHDGIHHTSGCVGCKLEKEIDAAAVSDAALIAAREQLQKQLHINTEASAAVAQQAETGVHDVAEFYRDEPAQQPEPEKCNCEQCNRHMELQWICESCGHRESADITHAAALIAEKDTEIERLKELHKVTSASDDHWRNACRYNIERAEAAERALAERRPVVRHVTAKLPDGNLLALRISHIEDDWTGLGIFIEGVPTLNERALAELDAQWRNWGIIEVAVRNSSVAEYMRHWEGRTEKAEAALTDVRRVIVNKFMMYETHMEGADGDEFIKAEWAAGAMRQLFIDLFGETQLRNGLPTLASEHERGG